MRFYGLRHTHASVLIAEGVHPKKIAERLGHAYIKLTMDLYGHLFEGSDKEPADRMPKLFGARDEETPGARRRLCILSPPQEGVTAARGYEMNMDIQEIQNAIERLSADQQRTLLDWLVERDLERWDGRIEEDFSEGGAGMEMLASIKRQVQQGQSAPMSEGRNRR